MTSIAADLSVVVTTYSERRWPHLLEALESLRRQSLPARDVVVVIDHNASLLARVRDALPDVVSVGNPNPRGLAGARNAGLSVAGGEVVAFMDDDAVAASDWIERLMARYSNPRVLGVGGAIEPIWQGGRPRWFPPEFQWVVGCSYRGLPRSLAEVRNLIGCNMSFRRDAIVSVGGFRSGIGRVGTRPLGCEETELCIRLRQRWPNCQLLYDPEIRVAHHVTSDRQQFRYLVRRCFAEGISKAQVARTVGQQAGLSAERSYVLRSLPPAVFNGLRGGSSGMRRSAAVISGLAATTAGYAYGILAQRGRRTQQPPAIDVLEWDDVSVAGSPTRPVTAEEVADRSV